MGLNLGNLLYKVKAKNTEFKSKMDESGRKIKDFDGKVDKSKKGLQNWTRTAQKVGAVAVTVFAGVATAGVYFIKAASDAQEMQNVLEVSFGQMSDDVNAWAEDTADAVNRSNYEIKNFVSTAMAMTTSMVDSKKQAAEMSKTITQLAVDLASFRNISDERAFEALTAALTGEAEALKRLGYNVQDTAVKQFALNQGITKSYEKLSIAEKTTLRYQLVIERLKDVMGDAERTSDSYANQLKGFGGEVRNLREELGTYLLPTATKFIGKLREIVEYINKLPEPIKKIAAQGMIITAFVTGIVGPLGLIAGYLPKIIAIISGTNVAFAFQAWAGGASTAAEAVGLLASSFSPFLVGAAIFAGLVSIVNAIFAIREETRLLTTDVEKLTEKELENRKATLESKKARLEELIADGGEERSILGAKGSTELAERRLEAVNDNLEETNKQLEKLKGNRDALTDLKLPEIKLPDLTEIGAAKKTADDIFNEGDRLRQAWLELGKINQQGYKDWLQEQFKNTKITAETRAQIKQKIEEIDNQVIDLVHKITDSQMRKRITEGGGSWLQNMLAEQFYLDKDISKQLAQELLQIQLSEDQALRGIEDQRLRDARRAEFDAQRSQVIDNYLELQDQRITANKKAEDQIKSYQYKTQQISLQEYKDYLEERLKEYKKNSQDYIAIANTIAQVEADLETKREAARRAREEHEAALDRSFELAIKAEDKMKEYQYKNNELSLQDYKDYLERRLEEYDKYTDEWYTIASKLAGVEADLQAKREERLKLRQDHEAAIDRSFELATEAVDRMKEYQYQNDEISLQGYIDYLQKRITAFDQYSLEWINIANKIATLEDELQAKREAARKAREDREAAINRGFELANNNFITWIYSVTENIETAEKSFNDFRQGLVDGLTDAIVKGEDFLTTLKSITDQIASMILKQGIVEPFVDWALGGLGVAHTGALVTTTGLVRDLPAYHSGGKIPGLESNEQLIKVIPGERVLSPGQNKAFESGEYGKTELVEVYQINAVDAKSFQRLLGENKATIVNISAEDIMNNGTLRKVMKRFGG